MSNADHDFYLACEAEAYRNPPRHTRLSLAAGVATVVAFTAAVVLCAGLALSLGIVFGGALLSALLCDNPPSTRQFQRDRAHYQKHLQRRGNA